LQQESIQIRQAKSLWTLLYGPHRLYINDDDFVYLRHGSK